MTALLTGKSAQACLARLLRPRTLAVFGGHAAAEIVRQNARIGFSGEIWPVHPRLAEMAGVATFRSVADLPAPPDAAFLGVNRHVSIELIGELARIGAGGAVAFASGFAESGGDGPALQARLMQAAGDMPFFGPNCYGYLNFFDRALTWPDQFGGSPVENGVAIITQSGNIGLNLTMQRRALPIGYLMTLGNAASVGHADAMHAVLDDPRVTAIGLHMEGISDPAALAAAAARARAQGVPVVVLKTGRSANGARIAQSHTAALGSQDAVVDAYFRRIGMARVDSLPTLLETLKLLHMQGPLPGRKIASLSCSGGEAALIADAAEAAGLDFVPLSTSAASAIAATLPELVSVSNPLDYHTFGWRNRAALTATFAAMMRAGADINLLILDFPRPDQCDTTDWDIAASALADAAAQTGRRAAVLATLPETMPEQHAAALAGQGIVPLSGLAESLAAIAAAASAGAETEHLHNFTAPLNAQGRSKALSEWNGKRRLAVFGVPVPTGELANTPDDATTAAAAIGMPVVVKAVGDQLAHKTEQGAVRLNLNSRLSVHAAAAALLPITGQVLVERMVTGTVAELIVGVARDASLGLYLMLGSGGVLAELVGDTAILLLPASRAEISTSLHGLRVSRLLAGFRGGPQGDMQAAIDAICYIQDFALANDNILQELDVNPLMVCARGQGAVAADVLMRLSSGEPHV
jgi:acyl-CoA synthetase (NDP forming)